MRAASLIILCGALLIVTSPLGKAEQRTGESLGRRGGSSERDSLLQPGPMSWAGRAILEEVLPSQLDHNQLPHTLLDHGGEGEQGEVHLAEPHMTRKLTGFSVSSVSSAVSSAARSSFSSSVGSSASVARSSSSGGYSGSAASASRSSSGSGYSGSSVSSSLGSSQVRTSYVPPSYKGPTTTSASGAMAVSNRVTMGYPAAGHTAAVPRISRPATPVPYASRPYANTYPGGYTLLFIPYYSPDYSGHHWAVYNDNNNFYGFDDGDTTVADYDYEDNHYLPAGCQYVGPDPSNTAYQKINRPTATAQPPIAAGAYGSGNVSAPAPGRSTAMPAAMAPAQDSAPGAYTGRRAILSVSPSYLAPAPAPERSSRDVQSASAVQDTSKSSSGTQPGLFSLLCKPIAAKKDTPSDSSATSNDNTSLIVLCTVLPGAFIIVGSVWICCSLKRKAR